MPQTTFAPALPMKIKLINPDQEADFIRHARSETLKAIGEEPSAALIEPSPFALYLIAYDEDNEGTRPVAMAEIAFHAQVYRSFSESPYSDSLHLDCFCDIEHMAGIRTIYVEPECRHKSAALYMQLIQAGGRVVVPLGARFATASTNADDAYLNRLYLKTGGKPMGRTGMDEAKKCEVSVYVFDIQELMNHKLMARAAAGAEYEIDLEIARTQRARNVWNLEERKSA